MAPRHLLASARGPVAAHLVHRGDGGGLAVMLQEQEPAHRRAQERQEQRHPEPLVQAFAHVFLPEPAAATVAHASRRGQGGQGLLESAPTTRPAAGP